MRAWSSPKRVAALVGFVILHLEDIEGGKAGYIVTLDVAPAAAPQRHRQAAHA